MRAEKVGKGGGLAGEFGWRDCLWALHPGGILDRKKNVETEIHNQHNALLVGGGDF